MPPPRTHVSVTPTSGLERAQVKWFNRLRGFGFLTRGEGTPDIFVHMETLRRYGITELRPGQFVLVRFGAWPQGPDGGRGAAGRRPDRAGLPLTADPAVAATRIRHASISMARRHPLRGRGPARRACWRKTEPCIESPRGTPGHSAVW